MMETIAIRQHEKHRVAALRTAAISMAVGLAAEVSKTVIRAAVAQLAAEPRERPLGQPGTSGPGVGSPGTATSSSGGETLGLPPGISVPLPGLASITGVGTGCEFGACGGGFFAGPGMEDHHIFPQAFQEWFAQHGIEIESYTIALSKAAHRLKPGGLHTKSGGNWNAAWKKWIEEHPNATPQQILNQGKKLLVDFGVGAGDVFSDIFIIVNPCVINPMAPYCNRGAYNGPA